jgi:hypothetical protein
MCDHRLMKRLVACVVCVCAGCASVGGDVAVHDVDVQMLRPTVGGLPVDAVVVDDTNLQASVRWSAPFGGSGAVLFFADRTLCSRGAAAPAGLSITAARYGSGNDVDVEMMKLDVAAAEEQALDADIDPATAEAWLVVDASSIDDAQRAAHALRNVRPVHIGVVEKANASSTVRLLLLPPGPPVLVTDTLPVSIQGPAVDVVSALRVLSGGPEPDAHLVTDTVTVAVSLGEHTTTWAAPSTSSARTAAWSSAFHTMTSAIERGCTVSHVDER